MDELCVLATPSLRCLGFGSGLIVEVETGVVRVTLDVGDGGLEFRDRAGRVAITALSCARHKR